jgi:hypothetical protein
LAFGIDDRFDWKVFLYASIVVPGILLEGRQRRKKDRRKEQENKQ